MAGHGGSRPGAGRKAKSEVHASAIVAAETKIADRLPELIDNLFLLAGGVKLQKPDKEGSVDVFTTLPDRDANKYLIDRILGKPTERHEHDFSNLSDAELLERAKGLAGGVGTAGADASAK